MGRKKLEMADMVFSKKKECKRLGHDKRNAILQYIKENINHISRDRGIVPLPSLNRRLDCHRQCVRSVVRTIRELKKQKYEREHGIFSINKIRKRKQKST
jgi:hypothetical protein